MTARPSLRILIIDDNAEDREMVARYLRRLDDLACELSEAEDVATAAQRLAAGAADLALLDLNMPDSEGVQTVTELMRLAPDVPIIVLTGCADQRVGEEAAAAGAFGYVVKDFDFRNSGLEPLIREAVRR